MSSRVAAALLLAPLLGGCPGQPPPALRDHGWDRAMGELAAPPKSGPVRRVRAVTYYHAGKPLWGFMAEAERRLVFTRAEADGKEHDAVLRLGYRRVHWGEDYGDFLAWTDRPRYELRLAPDGHALALSEDGARWSYVALDVPDELFVCFHTRVEAREPFDALPTTRALAREILASARRADGRVVGHPSDDGAGWSDGELRGALRYACAHLDDAALGRDVASALVREGMSAAIWDLPTRAKVVACLGAFARRDEAVQKTLVDTLERAPAAALEQRAFAAEGLAALADETAQRVLAADLDWRVRSRPRFSECDLAAREAWALAEVTERRRAAPREVEATLASLARSDVTCVGDATMEVVRAQSVRALAALTDAPARSTIDALATRCSGATPAWPKSFDNEWEVADPRDWSVAPVGCWAAAARARR